MLLQVDSIQSNALFILLVEKDAAFMRLAEDRFYNTYPCIIMTAKGQPDVASRSALYQRCTLAVLMSLLISHYVTACSELSQQELQLCMSP